MHTKLKQAVAALVALATLSAGIAQGGYQVGIITATLKKHSHGRLSTSTDASYVCGSNGPEAKGSEHLSVIYKACEDWRTKHLGDDEYERIDKSPQVVDSGDLKTGYYAIIRVTWHPSDLWERHYMYGAGFSAISVADAQEKAKDHLSKGRGADWKHGKDACEVVASGAF